MIGSLRGPVLERLPPATVLVEVGGVGYLCAVTAPTYGELEPGTDVFLHVHHHIREDAQTLYGFVSRTERDTFDVLVATHGVGPALAMAILSTYAPPALASAVAAGDIPALTAVPGIGKKTAERLMVELRERLEMPSGDHSTLARSAVPSAEVREALVSLGYGAEEIRDAMGNVRDGSDSESLLREALSVLGARRAG